jgi:hypothetical protein
MNNSWKNQRVETLQLLLQQRLVGMAKRKVGIGLVRPVGRTPSTISHCMPNALMSLAQRSQETASHTVHCCIWMILKKHIARVEWPDFIRNSKLAAGAM